MEPMSDKSNPQQDPQTTSKSNKESGSSFSFWGFGFGSQKESAQIPTLPPKPAADSDSLSDKILDLFGLGLPKSESTAGKLPQLQQQRQQETRCSEINVNVTEEQSKVLCELPGEEIIATIEGERVVNKTAVVQGLLCLTNYKLRFISKFNDENGTSPLQQINVDLLSIALCDRYTDCNGQQCGLLVIRCKDPRKYQFRFSQQQENQTLHFVTLLTDRIYFKCSRKYPAFTLGKHSPLEKEFNGWQVYDVKREFARQALPICSSLNLTTLAAQDLLKYITNEDKEICETYPPFLVVPYSVSSDEIMRCSRFRSRNRLPALTFGFELPKGLTTIWRSSQCMTGFMSRSADDEKMLSVIANQAPTKLLHIYDARPYMNAFGNKIAGKGFESTSSYKNSEIFFLEIHNIHKVRESYSKMVAASLAPQSEAAEWMKDVESSLWIEHISTIIAGTRKVCASMLGGNNVLIHCSDGWDRTSQLACLAQLCFDPYFRTIEGFQVLIEKDWVYFGHQFSLRLGHARNGNEEEMAPIFLQFLDCVHQMCLQFPSAFEFTQDYLYDIAMASFNCLFGTFLSSSYHKLMAEEEKIKKTTVSVWSWLNSQKHKYVNPFYEQQPKNNTLEPDHHPRSLRVWSKFFLSQSEGVQAVDHVQRGMEVMLEKHSETKQKLIRLESLLASLSIRVPENNC